MGIILISIFGNFQPTQNTQPAMIYSDFIHQVDQGNVVSVTINGQLLQGTLKNNQSFQTTIPQYSNALVKDLIKKNISVREKSSQQQTTLQQLFINWFPTIFIIAVWVYFLRMMRRKKDKSEGGNIS